MTPQHFPFDSSDLGVEVHQPAILELMPALSHNGGVPCVIHRNEGIQLAWTWLPLETLDTERPQLGYATYCRAGTSGRSTVLLAYSPDDDAPFCGALFERSSPIPGVVRQAAALVDGIGNNALRRFVKRALLRKIGLRGFWQSEASRFYHHAYPGGLGEHSLEIATMVATADGLTPEDRDLGIAFALLHDYGKLLCYGPNAGQTADSRQHEAIGLAELEPDVAILRGDDETIGAQMHELLGGPRVPRRSIYPLAIGRIVRAFDQMSCERARRSRERPDND
jgi:hypothetical protein